MIIDPKLHTDQSEYLQGALRRRRTRLTVSGLESHILSTNPLLYMGGELGAVARCRVIILFVPKLYPLYNQQLKPKHNVGLFDASLHGYINSWE